MVTIKSIRWRQGNEIKNVISYFKWRFVGLVCRPLQALFRSVTRSHAAVVEADDETMQLSIAHGSVVCADDASASPRSMATHLRTHANHWIKKGQVEPSAREWSREREGRRGQQSARWRAPHAAHAREWERAGKERERYGADCGIE